MIVNSDKCRVQWRERPSWETLSWRCYSLRATTLVCLLTVVSPMFRTVPSTKAFNNNLNTWMSQDLKHQCLLDWTTVHSFSPFFNGRRLDLSCAGRLRSSGQGKGSKSGGNGVGETKMWEDKGCLELTETVLVICILDQRASALRTQTRWLDRGPSTQG